MCWDSKIKVDLSSRKAGRHENIGDINNAIIIKMGVLKDNHYRKKHI